MSETEIPEFAVCPKDAREGGGVVRPCRAIHIATEIAPLGHVLCGCARHNTRWLCKRLPKDAYGKCKAAVGYTKDPNYKLWPNYRIDVDGAPCSEEEFRKALGCPPAPQPPSARDSLVSRKATSVASMKSEKPWQGSAGKKPWQYRVTAVIPHRNTPEHLELCVQFLQQQTERPCIMVVDTGSDDASLQRVLALRSESVEVHQIACHGTEDRVDVVCYAMDLAMSACRTEYLWCVHSDCFVINRNLLAELHAKSEGGKNPVIGYESVSANKYPECKGMVSHTCTLLHVPTMHRLDVSWSMQRLKIQMADAGREVVADVEMALNYRLRDRGVTPLILGTEQAQGVERDANRVHLRSATLGADLLAALPGAKTGKEEVLKELRELARRGSLQVRVSTRSRPEVLNLIYHVAPFSSNGVWIKNIAAVMDRIELFNGRRVVAIATGPGLVSPDIVKNEFRGAVSEFIEIPNDAILRESASFLQLLDRVRSCDPREATFYAHAKGVTKPNNRAAWSWAACMYRELLDDTARVTKLLTSHSAVGVSFRLETAWMFPGSFFWFRNDSLFSRTDWRTLENNITCEGLGWSVEAYPNRMFLGDAYRIYPKLRYWGEDARPLYDQAWWDANGSPIDSEVLPQLSDQPNHKYAVRHFGDQWISKIQLDDVECGRDDLFNDQRIKWFIEKSGGVSGQRILELGSLEGGHTYLLDKAGANVLGIEANIESYLRSLVSKEVTGMKNARFLPGDFLAHLRKCERAGTTYDAVVAIGVLYHMTKPLELLRLISTVTDRLFLWSHYYDTDLINACQCAKQWFYGGVALQEAGDVRCMGYRHDYGERQKQPHHIGGVTDYSYWIARDAILNALSYFGFDSVEICFDEPEHKHGPAFACLAQRT